ncbi:MAG: cupin domain-containing protein [Acidobacteria bacterium]|nr:cupin domain-containing protein [Acidobacteriota bacterium]
MNSVVNPLTKAQSLTELWSPRVLGTMDNYFVKVAKVHGTFVWHDHADEDELFYILEGCLVIEMEDQRVELNAGDLFVVPKGVQHRPIAEQPCLLMLIERQSTQHTGTVESEWTRSVDSQQRPN